MDCETQIGIAFVGGMIVVPLVLGWGLIMPWWVPGSWWGRPERRR